MSENRYEQAPDVDIIDPVIEAYKKDVDRTLPCTVAITAAGQTARVVTLEQLIKLKRAAGRPKDLEVIAELEALLEERRQVDPPP